VYFVSFVSVYVCIVFLSVYHLDGHKSHDDPDATHHSSGNDARYVTDHNRTIVIPKRQVGDIIRTPATPCEL
jgi:hypothetical protein